MIQIITALKIMLVSFYMITNNSKMKMKKTITIFILSICSFGALYGQTKLTHGLTLNGGSGDFHDIDLSDAVSDILENGGSLETEYQFGAGIGYKFRLKPQTKPFFYDLDLNLGIKKYNYHYSNYDGVEFRSYSTDTLHNDSTKLISGAGNIPVVYIALGASFNYKLYKGLYAGAGVEPTFYFDTATTPKWKFDIPAVVKIGYDLKYVDFAFAYKYGLLDMIGKSRTFDGGKLHEWQLQMFIPF